MTKPKASPSAVKKKTPQPKAEPEPAEQDPVPEVTGSQREYETFLPRAQAIEARDVRPYRLDPSLAYHNVQTGVAALLPLADRIEEELPKIDMEAIRALPDLALGLCFAASRVDRGGSTSKQLAAPLSAAYALREKMLSSAVSLAVAGVVPKREVEKIQEGRGSLDAAQDCVDLAALFVKHAAAVRGKTPITAAQVTEAAAVGTSLLKVLRPGSAKRDRGPGGELKDAIEIRNRFGTLVVARYELARRVAHWFWGDEADRRVPPLQARVSSRRKASTRAKPAAQKPEKSEP